MYTIELPGGWVEREIRNNYLMRTEYPSGVMDKF
jgi:hypothetical protein